MAAIFYKWFLVFVSVSFSGGKHPVFVSVTEIAHNVAGKSLEISCKIFRDDFEDGLRKTYHTKIDLQDVKLKASMGPMVNGYILKHLSIKTDGKLARMKFIGFEQQEAGIISYYEIRDVAKVQKIEVMDNILYEYKPQQMEVIHAMVNGERKSMRLNNPEDRAFFLF